MNANMVEWQLKDLCKFTVFFCTVIFVTVSCGKWGGNMEQKLLSSQEIALGKAAVAMKVPKSHLMVNIIRSPFFEKFEFFQVSTRDVHPETVILAVSKERRVYSLFPKNNFKELVKAESVSIDTADRALAYARFFLRLTKEHFPGGYKILNDMRDIDGIRQDQIESYQGTIKPPSVEVRPKSYLVEFFAWGFGKIEKQSFHISKLGNVSHQSSTIAKKVGTFITFD